MIRPVSASKQPKTEVPNHMGAKVFTSQWLEPDQPSTPVDYGTYGYLVSRNLYEELLVLVDSEPVVSLNEEEQNADT